MARARPLLQIEKRVLIFVEINVTVFGENVALGYPKATFQIRNL